jgi:signal transduction histidine kinase
MIGVNEARAIQNTMDAERAAVRAEQLEVQRDVLDYLNGLLRHEVLNATNVISGYASLLREGCDDPETRQKYSGSIYRKSEEVTSVVQDVRVLLEATKGRREFDRLDLAALLRREIEKLTDVDEAVEVETSIPESVYVEGDALLRRVFGNLLSNAVEHNESAPPRVSVTLDERAETVSVEIADNGPGIPEEEVETLFDRPENEGVTHGLGLYLVGKLTRHYGGTIELVETCPDGTAFRVDLPKRASNPDDPGETPPDTSPFVPSAGARHGGDSPLDSGGKTAPSVV